MFLKCRPPLGIFGSDSRGEYERYLGNSRVKYKRYTTGDVHSPMWGLLLPTLAQENKMHLFRCQLKCRETLRDTYQETLCVS